MQHVATEFPRLAKPSSVTGETIAFRNAAPSDAEFILSLRTDDKKSRYLSKTPPAVGQQIAWLERYADDDTQIYFIIHDRSGNDIGTVRIYDQQGNSFCWGSWIIKDGAPASSALESALMIYKFALLLGFRRSHFDVRQGNRSVWRFHENFGARRIREDDLDIYFTIERTEIERSLARYGRFIPNGISVEW